MIDLLEADVEAAEDLTDPGPLGVPAAFGALCPELLRGVEGAGAELSRHIPWLRVFVEGVVIVGSLAGVSPRS